MIDASGREAETPVGVSVREVALTDLAATTRLAAIVARVLRKGDVIALAELAL